jgi:hypothetical protein
MRDCCVRQPIQADVAKARTHLKRLGRAFAHPATHDRDEGQIALVENDHTLLDSNGEWILREAAWKFYQTHEDRYDFLSFFPLSGPDNGAYHLGVFNAIQGIGKGHRDRRREYGSGGRLQSVHLFYPLSTLPTDPTARITDNNDSSLSLIAQEFGHRWAAFVWFRDRENGGLPSPALLGRDRSHWSFFLDTRASCMEGNKWGAINSSYFSLDETDGYCELDQYLMGLRGPEEVQPMTLIVSQDRNRRASDRPVAGIQISGRPKIVSIQEIIDFEGPRVPGVAHAPKAFRHAFILLLRHGEVPRRDDLRKLDRIRLWWEAYFFDMTGGRGTVDTSL